MIYLEVKKQLQEELKMAIKSGNSNVKAVISTVSAKLNAAQKDADLKGMELSEADIISVFAAELKQTNESKSEAEKVGRNEAVEKANIQIEFLQKFLPKQLTESELTEAIQEIIKGLEIENPTKKDFGRIMKIASPKFKGKADGKLVSSIVGKLLS